MRLRLTFGGEAEAFLGKKGVRLVGDRMDDFLRAYVAAKVHAYQILLRNAERDYGPDPDAARYPKFEASFPEHQFDCLWESSAKPRSSRRPPGRSGSRSSPN